MKIKFVPHLKLFFILATLLVSYVNAFAADSDKEQLLDEVVAVVDDDVITQSELQREIKNVRGQLRQQNIPTPPMDVLQRQVLEREIIKQLQLQFAKRTGIMVDDNELNNTIDNIAKQNKLTLKELRNVLQKDNVDFASYREDIRNQMIISRLQQREVYNRIVITDQEIDSFIATQTVQGDIGKEYLLSHILVSIPEAASPESIKKAENKARNILKELQGGADFKQVAIRESDGQQALEGGNLGWRKAGQLPTLFAAAVARMKKGDVSDIIRSPSGFHIIKLMDSRTSERYVETQYHARHILIRPNELMTEVDIISRLRQLRQRIEGGESFADLARAHSDDRASSVKGGDLGWFNPGDMAPQFAKVVKSLKINEISEPFQTQFGWHIVQLLGKREVDNTDEVSRTKARDLLRQRKADEMLETWLRQLREEAYVEYKIKV